MTKSLVICKCLKWIRRCFPLKDTALILQTHLVLNSSSWILHYTYLYGCFYNMRTKTGNVRCSEIRPPNPVNQGHPTLLPQCPVPTVRPIKKASKEGGIFNRVWREKRLWERCFLIKQEQGRQHKGGSKKEVCLDRNGTPCQTWEILPRVMRSLLDSGSGLTSALEPLSPFPIQLSCCSLAGWGAASPLPCLLQPFLITAF